MNLYKALLIDIIYSLQYKNSDNEQTEPEQRHIDRQNLALNYRIAQSLIDVIFKILHDELIEFDANLRSRQDFLHAKEQLSQESILGSVDLDPSITTEEIIKLGNPIIRGIIQNQELESYLNTPKQSILFIHLMFLCFSELRQNNSMIAKRKSVLLKLFEQQTYSYPRSESYNSFGSKIDTQDDNRIHNFQNQTTMKDAILTNELSNQSKNQQSSQFFYLKQTDSNPQNELRKLRQISRSNKLRFYFRSNYPIEIEKLSSHLIKMTFSQDKQFVYRWSQLDLPSYLNLMATHSKAFYCWTSMLKLLNLNQFQAFIDDQVGDSEQDDEIINDFSQLDQLIIKTGYQLDNIVRIDKKLSIVKFPNKVIIIEQFKIQRILNSIEQSIEAVNNLVMKKHYIDSQIEQVKKKLHIKTTLEEWYERQQQLVNRILCNKRQSNLNDLPLQEQQSQFHQREFKSHNVYQIDKAIQTQFVQAIDSKMDQTAKNQSIQQTDQNYNGISPQCYQPEFIDNEVQQTDKAIQTQFIQNVDPRMNQNADITSNQQADQNQNNIGTQQCMLPNSPEIFIKGVKQHSGYYNFGKEYPLQIDRLNKSTLLIKMKGNKKIIVEWCQFNYESLNNLFVEKINLQAGQVWSILLILIDEDQFFKLWKGETTEQIQIKEDEHIPQMNSTEESDQLQLPEIIISIDFYRYIMKFRNCVKVLTKVDVEKYRINIDKYEEINQKIVFRKSFYNRKMKMFRELFLEQEKNKIKQSLSYQITQEFKTQDLISVTPEPQLPTGAWIFDEDYPVRIKIIDKDNLKFEFKNKVKNTTVNWQQLDYRSLIKLIDAKINIRAGQAWTVMLILLDHNQFYNLWKNYHQRNENQLMSQSDHKQVDCNYLSIINNKRDHPDYIPLRFIRLNEIKVIVKFENYVQVFTNEELVQYKILMDIPDAGINKFKFNVIKPIYNQNIKAFEERLKSEQSQLKFKID